MPVLFTVTVFASALLLFLVQPMVGKMVLPYVGGSSAVWNTCMVFFQALLLGGYWYAHKLTSLKDQKKQVAVHLCVFAVAVAVLAAAHFLTPDGSALSVVKRLAPRGTAVPFFPLVLMLAVAVGIPFFVVSTSAPLLQRWFTATGHPSSRDPYFLYAASNAGSLLSLLGYLVFVEPHFRLAEQTWLFAGGFLLLLLAVAACGRATLDPVRPPGKPSADAPRAAAAPAAWRKWKWAALGFVPSSLMLGITTKMTTDVGSFPLLWLIPLALYLVTFIIAFGKMPGWFRLVLVNLTPVVTLLLVFVETSGVKLSDFGQAVLHVSNFFLLSLLMHGELAHDRPDPKFLTNYFLWISFGGVLGGLFNALLAPLAFPQLYEYHIAIVIGCLLLPAVSAAVGRPDPAKTAAGAADGDSKADDQWLLSRLLDFVVPVLMIAAAAGLVWLDSWARVKVATAWTAEALTAVFARGGWRLVVEPGTVMQFAVFAPPCMLCFLFIDRPLRFGLCVLAVLFVHHYREANQAGVKMSYRSPYGILRIDEGPDRSEQLYMPATEGTVRADDGAVTKGSVPTGYPVGPLMRSLSHGTTLHGRQFAEDFELPTLRDQVRVLGAFSGLEALVLHRAPEVWDHSKDPLTYYHRTGPVGAILREGFRRKRLPRVGMVGLGTGSAAAYAEAGQTMTFYEIDRAVKDMIESGDELGPQLLGKMAELKAVGEKEIRRTTADGRPTDADESKRLETIERSVREYDVALAEPVRGLLRAGGKIDAVLAAIDRTGVALAPRVRRMIAGGSRSFTYVTDARKRGAEVEIVLGDARLTLEEQPDRRYDLLLIDAFSSDSIPTHLLTVEAVRMYRDRLAANGLLALHVSNRHLRLEPVVQAIADELGMVCRLYADDNDAPPGKTPSSWVVLARNDKELGEAFLNPPPPAGSYRKDGDPLPLTWRPILPDARIPAWTDDYMDVLRVTRFAELQAVRRWFGLHIPVKNWEDKTKFVDRQYRKPPADRLYGFSSLTPDLRAVSVELDRVMARKARLKADELAKPPDERRFTLELTNPDKDTVSDRLDDEIERLEELDAAAKRKP